MTLLEFLVIAIMAVLTAGMMSATVLAKSAPAKLSQKRRAESGQASDVKFEQRRRLTV